MEGYVFKLVFDSSFPGVSPICSSWEKLSPPSPVPLHHDLRRLGWGGGSRAGSAGRTGICSAAFGTELSKHLGGVGREQGTFWCCQFCCDGDDGLVIFLSFMALQDAQTHSWSIHATPTPSLLPSPCQICILLAKWGAAGGLGVWDSSSCAASRAKPRLREADSLELLLTYCRRQHLSPAGMKRGVSPKSQGLACFILSGIYHRKSSFTSLKSQGLELHQLSWGGQR